MTKLKPCPFCGSKAITLTSVYSDLNQVGCSNLSCSVLPQTFGYETPEKAIEAWNRRYTDEQT